MHRNPRRLSDETFDLLVVGGGVSGVCIARDAVLRGLKVALIEKDDFAEATSANNSKLIHGGLRYLRNFELGLVRESLRERRIWQRIAPHLVHPLPFLVPMFGAGWMERAKLATGLRLYDWLSYDRGRLDDPYQRLPGHSWLDSESAVGREPLLGSKGFSGGFIYYDAQMYAPERLALECLIDADEHGATVANYTEAKGFLVRKGRVEGCTVKDRFTGAQYDVLAKQTIVAAGPWTDLFLERGLGKPAPRRVLRSKGIHVIVPAMTHEFALTVAARDGHFFVLPWRGHALLGTTDTPFDGNPDDVGVTGKDVSDFLGFVNQYLPNAKLTPDIIEHAYAGLRPLVDDGTNDSYGASRRAEIINHAKTDRLEGLTSVIGGKWTSSRALAEKVVDMVAAAGHFDVAPCRTASTCLPGGRIDRFLEFERSQAESRPDIAGVGHLVRLYGTRLGSVLKLTEDTPALGCPVGSTGDIGAQVVFAIREEMAMTLADVLMRRTGIGQLGLPSEQTLKAASTLAAAELGWSEEKRVEEVDTVMQAFYKQRTSAGRRAAKETA